MKVPQTEAEKFEFEPWPQASKFVSWKVSFRREAISGSTHLRLISEWSPEIDLAIGIEDLDHSGFTSDKHQIEFETLDSKIAKGIMKTLPAEFKRKINFLQETQHKNRRSMLTGRQTMFQIFSFFNMTPGHTTNLSDLLSVEVVQRQPQHVQSSLGRNTSVLGNDLDERVLQKLHERQVIKSTLMKNAMTLCHQNMILKTAKRLPKIEDYC